LVADELLDVHYRATAVDHTPAGVSLGMPGIGRPAP